MRIQLACLLLLLGAFVVGCGSSDAPAPASAPTDPIALNGWPVSNAPSPYVGSGYAVGDQFPDVTATDQNGNTDVALSQFYGAMVVVSLDAGWGPFSAMGAAEFATMKQELEDESDEYRVYIISAYFEDAALNTTDASDGLAWATTHSLTDPVLVGSTMAQLWADVGTRSAPSYVILDPLFEVRAVLTGWVGTTAFKNEVRNAWTAFRAANPTWTSPFIDN